MCARTRLYRAGFLSRPPSPDKTLIACASCVQVRCSKSAQVRCRARECGASRFPHAEDGRASRAAAVYSRYGCARQLEDLRIQGRAHTCACGMCMPAPAPQRDRFQPRKWAPRKWAVIPPARVRACPVLCLPPRARVPTTAAGSRSSQQCPMQWRDASMRGEQCAAPHWSASGRPLCAVLPVCRREVGGAHVHARTSMRRCMPHSSGRSGS